MLHLLILDFPLENLDWQDPSRDITLPTKVCLVKAMVVPVVIYGCERWDYKESWALKNWCFWTVMLEKALESPLDCKEIQPVHPKITPGCSLEGLMLKLKLQYFSHLMRRTDSLEKTLMLGKIEGRRRRVWQRIRWLDGITDSRDMCLCGLGVDDGQGGLACCGSWGRRESDTTERLNWAELNP